MMSIQLLFNPPVPPAERHVIVLVRRHPTTPGLENGYFFLSGGEDHGGSGPFDWRMEEASERAQSMARNEGVGIVVVRAQPERPAKL